MNPLSIDMLGFLLRLSRFTETIQKIFMDSVISLTYEAIKPNHLHILLQDDATGTTEAVKTTVSSEIAEGTGF